MKKTMMLLFIGVMTCLSTYACDFCTVYIGIEPMYNSNSLQLRYRTSRYKGTHSSGLTFEKHGEGESTKWSELYQTISARAVYYPHEKLQLTGVLNYAHNIAFDNKLLENQVFGLGDLSLSAMYQWYHTKDLDKPFQQRLLAGFGIILPTGNFQNSGNKEYIDPLMQAGTGAFGVILSSTYLVKKKALGLTTNVSLTFVGENPDYYQFANRLNITSLVS